MYVYKHIRNDTSEVFYIGIGKSISRAYSKSMRNKHWKNIVNKTEYTVEIVTSVDLWEEACQIEKYLISHYGRKDVNTGCLVNMTDGGEGCFGKKCSNETKLKISKSNSKENHPMFGKKGDQCYMFNKIANNARKIINTKKNIIYNNIKEAAESINMNYNTFYGKLKKNEHEDFSYYLI